MPISSVFQSSNNRVVPVANLGSVELVTLSQQKAHTIEQLADMAYTRTDKYMLAIVETGLISATQGGRQCRLEEAHYALFDCGSQIRFSGVGEYSVVAVFIPRFLLQARLRNAQTIMARPLSSVGSPWRIVSNLLRILVSEIRNIPAPVAYGYASQVVELVSIAVEADTQVSGDYSGRKAIFRRCTAYIKSHLADEELTPNKIAQAMGISVRYLHKVFQESGDSVCEYLRSSRLETARMELADQRKSSVQIREIAHRVGFRSQAHFAAAFRQRYGVSATEWRRDALRQIGAGAIANEMIADGN